MSENNDVPREVHLIAVPEPGNSIELGHPPPNALIEAHMQAASVPAKPPTKPPQAGPDSGKSATPPKAKGT